MYQEVARPTSQQQLHRDSLEQELDAAQRQIAAQQETIELHLQELSRLRTASHARLATSDIDTEVTSAEVQLQHAQEQITMLKDKLSQVLQGAESAAERELREECEAQAKLLQHAEWDRQALQE